MALRINGVGYRDAVSFAATFSMRAAFPVAHPVRKSDASVLHFCVD